MEQLHFDIEKCYVGNEKHGDLKSYFAYGFKYDRVDYKIAYTINDNDEIVIVILAGPHEKFYGELKRIVNGWAVVEKNTIALFDKTRLL